LCIGAGSFLQQEIDEFQARFAAVRVRVRGPHAVHSVVIVAESVFDRAAAGGDAAESEIDGTVLRSALPQSEEVGLGFVQALGISGVTQRASQAELIFGVGRIAGQGGTEVFHGSVEVSGLDVGQALRVELASAGLLVGVETVDEMADGRKGGYRRHKEKNDNGGSRARDELRELP